MQFVREIECTSVRGRQIKRARASAEEMATSWSSPGKAKLNHRSRASLKKTMDGLLLSLRGKTRSRVGSPGFASAIAGPPASALSLVDLESSELVPVSQVLGAGGGSGRKLSAAAVCKREGGKGGGGGRSRHPESKWKDSLLKARLALRVKREKKKAKHAKLSEARSKLNRKKDPDQDWDGDDVEAAAAHPTLSDDVSHLEFPFRRPSVEELRAFAKTILNDGLVYRLIEH